MEKQTIHLQSTTQTKTIIIHRMLAGNQLCIHAPVCQRGHVSTISNAGFCSEERSLVASKKHAGTNTVVESQRTTENCLRMSEHCAKSAKNTSDKSCLERVTLCIDHVKKLLLLKRSPRRLHRLSPVCFASGHPVEPIWTLLFGPSCRRRNCSGRPDSRVQSPSMGHHFLTHNVSKCSPFPFEIRYQAWKGFSCLSHTVKWSDFNASFASCIVLVLFQCTIQNPDGTCAAS